jgi:hypothetical protein
VLEALSAGAEEITRELAPRSVEVRLRGRDPEFVLSAALDEPPAEEPYDAAFGDDEGGTWRITLHPKVCEPRLKPRLVAMGRR